MLTHFNRLGQAAAVTALTVGVAFAAAPAQKASAQSITGAGASSVITLLRDNTSTAAGGAGPVWDYANSFGTPYNYVVTGSGAGRTAFLNGLLFPGGGFGGTRTDFTATDGIGISFNGLARVGGGATGGATKVLNNTIVDSSTNQPVIDPLTGVPYIVVNEATLNVGFVYNVPSFNVNINGATACRILRGNASLGDPVNWNQVVNASGFRGPSLPIRRVARGDVSGTTAALQGPATPTVTNYGLVSLCNGQVPGIPAAPSFTGSGMIPSIIGPGVNGFNDGTAIPNLRPTDIIVNGAAPQGTFNPSLGSGANGAPANAHVAAFQARNNSNSNSYDLGVINTLRDTPGAIGYVETAIAVANSVPLVVIFDTLGGSTSTVAVGPTYVIFRGNYFLPNGQQDLNTVSAAQNVCYGAIFSGYLSNNSPSVYPRQAGFNINTAGGAFPYLFPSPEAGADTDNYGSYGDPSLAGGNEFGPCSRIGGAGVVSPNERTIAATLTVSGSTRTLSSFTLLGSSPAVTTGNPVAGDIIDATTSSGTIVRGTVLSVSGNTLRLYVNQSNTSGIVFDSGNSNPGQTNNVYTFNF